MYDTVKTELCFMRQAIKACIEKKNPVTVDLIFQVKNRKA